MKYNDKRMLIYEKLGAKEFQKIVFIIEKLKYSIIEKFIPNLDKWYFKQCDKSRDKTLKKCKKESEKQQIIEFYRLEKLKFKKELTKKENRNYHIDLNNPDEFKKYLEYNKNIHIKGLVGNITCIIFIILLNIILLNPFPLFFYSLLTFETISTIINFQCINLQNYNLCRLENEKMKRVLTKISDKRKTDLNKNMKEGIRVIGNSFRNSIDIPTIDDIIDNIKTKKEAQELLEYAKKHLQTLNKKNNKLERKKAL